MLRLDTVTLNPSWEPPRPEILPRKRVQVRTGSTLDDTLDWGLEPHRVIKFASSDRQGFLTNAQAHALIALAESGRAFQLETDLLKPLGGAPDTYVARFPPDKGSAPLFTPATPDGTRYRFDLTLWLQ